MRICAAHCINFRPHTASGSRAYVYQRPCKVSEHPHHLRICRNNVTVNAYVCMNVLEWSLNVVASNPWRASRRGEGTSHIGTSTDRTSSTSLSLQSLSGLEKVWNIQSSQKLKATLANPTTRRFLIHYLSFEPLKPTRMH